MWSSNSKEVSDVGKTESKDGFYDSGRTDSGFLSGNLQSEQSIVSGEIKSEEEAKDEKCVASQEMKIDSGVDLGLSGQFSDLCLEEQNDLDKEGKNTQEIPPWEIYFQQDDDGDTQLHIAIIQGSIEVAFNLIRMIPNPRYLDTRNDLTQTALHLAVRTSQSRIVRRLVVAGANTRVVDNTGNTALHVATLAGDLLCVKALTERVSSAEVAAAQLRYVPEHRQLHPPELDMNNYEGLTCLHMALITRNMAVLKYLVGFGADINAQEYKCGRTCLHLAAELGDEKLAYMLLQDLHADPEVPNYAGHTPYQTARRNPSFMRSLVAFGAPEEDAYFSSDDDEDEFMPELRNNGVFVNATA